MDTENKSQSPAPEVAKTTTEAPKTAQGNQESKPVVAQAPTEAPKAQAPAEAPKVETAKPTTPAPTPTPTPTPTVAQAVPAANPANTGDQESDDKSSELEVLKQRADLMGIGYSNNIGVDTLRKKISDKLNLVEADEAQDDEEAEALVKQNLEANVMSDPLNPLAGDEAGQEPVVKKGKRQAMHDEYMRLIRCRITNMDPKKKDLPGEIFTVANETLGTVKKFVPYGEFTDEGYHLPYWLYLELSDRKFLNIRTTKEKGTGHIRVTSTWAKEFAIEVLAPLTQEELDALATAQIASGSVERETFEA